VTVLIAIIDILGIQVVSSTASMGLVISSMMVVSTLIGFGAYTACETSKGMGSVQRIYQYIDDHNFEADFEKPECPKENWPSEGVVSINNLVCRYRENLPSVLRGVTFETRKHEKVGIVGRTGSGKSTTILALARIIEQQKDPFTGENLGRIEIDGVDIHKIGLHVLRQAITIIPQDPILLQGSLKFNIDPIGEFSDQEIILSLKKCQVWNTLNIIVPDGETEDFAKLNMAIEDGGSNLSQGQRQLVCISRALMKKTKILMMDEATANIDHQTEGIIQDILMQEFNESTIITIAHRLNSIIQYDKIVFMVEGQVAEVGSPIELLNKDSNFRALVRENGKDFEEDMINLALRKC
jgi:ABC-type multidrug transport system fused ATPase/permease subunit